MDASNAPGSIGVGLQGIPASALTFYGVELRRVEADGSESTILDGTEIDRGTLDDSTGALSFRLDAPLGVGRYRIVLSGGSLLSRSLSRGRWDPSQDRTVSEFEVKGSTATTVTSDDLGQIGPDVRSIAGSLTGSAASQASYRIRLDSGHALWRLGLQLDAGRIGSPLLGGITVYDADGNVAATTSARLDLPLGFPNDPYLFVGLGPGEYDVVVTKPEGQTGGDFRLNVVADPAATMTKVAAFAVDQTDGEVMGFTISFTSPIDPARLASQGILVIEAGGGVHLAHLTRVEPGLQRLGFEFDQPLPAGEYHLLATDDGPIVDLIGRVPIAEGLSAGILAAWMVSPNGEATVWTPPSTNLGRGEFSLNPGQSIEIPILVDQAKSLILRSILTNGGVSIEVIGEGFVKVVDPASGTPGQEYSFELPAGSYVLRLTGVGEGPATGGWSLDLKLVSAESLIASAVGPGGALSLRLGQSGDASTPASTQTSSSHSRSSPTAGANARMGPLSSASPFSRTAASRPIGRPSTGSVAIAAVGPSVMGGRTAVAWAGASSANQGAAASLILSVNGQADDGLPRGPAGMSEPTAATPTFDGEVTLTAQARATDEGDDAAILQADRVIAAVQGGLRWLLDGPSAESAPHDLAGVIPRTIDPAAAEAADGEGPSDGKVERASFELPLGILVLTTATFHFRRAALRWWRKRKAAAGGLAQVSPGPYRGPRRMSPTAARAPGVRT
ncbi:hypothetical protein [Planctomyces sp. SH-PL62]|uniref:hypothetical protein n=1 Tax=Planctomyces sp. SH-PL62 TaxID=1636152 RepID=UPI0012E7E58A|nr:hypothetical protein [Planctomyces sp. SH-PL62]